MVNKKEDSIIFEQYEYALKRKEEIGKDNVFDFSVGNPAVPCPKYVNDKLIELINNIDPVLLHSYTSSCGISSTRKAIADYLNKTYNAGAKEDLIFLTVGASAGLSIVFHALLKKDDEVILFAPYYPEYKTYIETTKAKVVIVNCNRKTFMPNLDELEKAVSKKTKIVIINSPNNPTGVVYSEDFIKKISLILKNKQQEFLHDIYLLSDEPYRELIYDKISYPFITNYYENSLVTYSFSKSLSLPGERIGYILVSSRCKKNLEVFSLIKNAAHSLGFICISSLFQYLIPHCLGITSSFEIYKENRDLLYNELSRLGYEVIYPSGAFYLFVKALESDAKAFALKARDYELILIPSDTFGIKGYVRISYCASKDIILKSFKAFESLKKYYQS